jgi:5-methylcytosine-specific restriction protein A
MPQINKPRKKNIPDGNRIIRQKIYGTMRWRQLRLTYLMEHPLCERCLEKGITTLAEDVHHITSFMQGNDLPSMKKLAYNYKNLQSLCRKCHTEQHSRH